MLPSDAVGENLVGFVNRLRQFIDDCPDDERHHGHHDNESNGDPELTIGRSCGANVGTGSLVGMASRHEDRCESISASVTF
jgi:hypothetical protein